MTVVSTTSAQRYHGSGSTGPFTFGWRFLSNADIKVYRVDAPNEVDPSLEIKTLLTEGTNYTLSGAGSYQGGSLSLVSPLVAGKDILIERETRALQTIDIRNQGNSFLPELHEDALDALTMMVQDRAREVLDNALEISGLKARMPDALDKYIGPMTGGDVSVGSVAALRALGPPGSGVGSALLQGYSLPGDGGGGPLRVWKGGAAPGTYIDNGGSIIVPTGGDGSGAWLWEWSGDIDIAWFGAKGGADSTAAIIAAAATGKPLAVGYGDYIVSTPVTLAQRLQGAGADDGQTTFTLTATGQFIIGDWFTKMDGFLMRSAVNDKVFIKSPMSYFTCTNFKMAKVGAATGQCGIEFDTSAASVYFCNVDHFNISLPYTIRVSGNGTQVFNANRIGGLASGYYQSFLSAISVDGVLACDGNEFCGYFETGTNLFNLSAGALRQNRFRLVQDNVTNTFNGIAVTAPNIWEILDGGFKSAGVYPLNQVFIGPVNTKVRATNTSAQSIPNAAATVLTFDTETFDTLSEFSNGTGIFTAKNTGYYRVNASAISAATTWAVGNRWQILIFKNGIEYATGERNEVEAAYTGQRSSSVSALVYLAAGGTLTARLIHNKGAAVSLDSSPTGNYLEIGAV